MGALGIAFAAAIAVLNVFLPGKGGKNFDYWYDKGMQSESLQEQVYCYTEAIKKWNGQYGVYKLSEAYNNRGIIYLQKSMNVEALEDFSKAVEYNPAFAKAYANRASVYHRKKMYTEAINDYNKAIDIDPSLVGAYNNRGAVYDDLDMFDEAIRDYSKAIALDPQYSKAYYNRGISYYKRKDYAKSRMDFAKAEEKGYIFTYTSAMLDNLFK